MAESDLKINYLVASVVRDTFAAQVEFQGQTIDANVTGLVVELTSEDDSMGHTYRFPPSDVVAAEELFVVGERITATFTSDA